MHSDQLDSAILAKIKAGDKTHARIATEEGVSQLYVKRLADIAGFNGPLPARRLAEIAALKGGGKRSPVTATIKAMLAQGKSRGEIKACCGVSRQYVSIVAKGGANSTPPQSKLAKAILKRLKQAKGFLTNGQIAAEFGVSTPYVSRLAKYIK